jgi:hypothetical protein
MVLAHAPRLKVRIKQLDFFGAFLQAPMRSRMFVTIPKIFGVLFSGVCSILWNSYQITEVNGWDHSEWKILVFRTDGILAGTWIQTKCKCTMPLHEN